ncbi:MAG: exodeoxyribonuclease VII large subunit [Limnobacter sp.]|nr:exodeoxyribonuclease VII large subunit [Limnobacter sp.]
MTEGNRVLTVSDFLTQVLGVLRAQFPLAQVQGEISQITRASSGHWYFSLKDERAVVQAVMWRGDTVRVGFCHKWATKWRCNAALPFTKPEATFRLCASALKKRGRAVWPSSLCVCAVHCRQRACLMKPAKKRCLPIRFLWDWLLLARRPPMPM